MESGRKASDDAMNVRSQRLRGGGKGVELLLRVLALALTMAAAVVLGVDKQTKIISLKILDSLPPLNVPVVANWHHFSAFVFFVASNAVACAYAAISVVIAQSRKKTLTLTLTVVDVLMVALLFSSNGATTSLGLMAYQGNSHVRWNKVCNVFTKFCDQVAAAIVLSLLGGTAFVLLAVLAALRLHKNAK